MPQVVNGVGTWYYGKKNKVVRQAVCPQCGNRATLTSYDTRLFFVVIFIPIIPLQKRRIIEECTACRQHRLMPLKQYNDLRDGVLGDALKQFDRKPTEPDHAKMVLTAHASLYDWQGVQEFTPKILKYHDEDTEVLLTLGAVQRRLSLDDEARVTYNRILDLDSDNKEAKEEKAGILMEQGKAAEAHRLIQHVIDNRESDKWWLLMRLCSVYQADGLHKEALELLDAVEAMVPNVAEDNAFKKMRAASNRNQHRATPLGTGAYKNLHDFGKEDHTRRNLIRFAFGLVGVLILIAGVYTAAAIHMGKNQIVFIVNGLNNPYLVTVNGDGPYRVGSLQASEVTVPQGEINVEVISEDYTIEPFTVEVSDFFLTRPFKNKVFVINPDGTAILEKQVFIYSAGPVEDEDFEAYPDEYFAGEVMYSLDKVDYPFEISPEEINLASKTDSAVKTELSVLGGEELGEESWSDIRLYMLERVFEDKKDVARVALKLYQFDGQFGKLSWILRSTMEPDDFQKIIEVEVEKRPVDTKVHRSYQSFLMDNKGWEETLAIYRALETEESDSPEIAYLLARVTPDPDEAISLFTKGLASEENAVTCHNALAMIYLMNGEFTLAHEHTSIIHSMKDESLYNEYYYDTALATGNVGDLIPEERVGDEEYHWSATHSIYHIGLVAIDQGKEAALAYLEASLAKQRGVSTEEEMEEFRQSALLTIDGVSGQLDAAYQTAQKMLEGNMFDEYFTALMMGDVEAAIEAYGQYDYSEEGETYDPFEWMDVEDSMLLATLARRSGLSEIEKQCLDVATSQLLDSGNVSAIIVAEALSGTSPEDPAYILRARLDLISKKAILLYLGERTPENRESYWDLVRKLNFHIDDYRLTYAKLMGDW